MVENFVRENSMVSQNWNYIAPNNDRTHTSTKQNGRTNEQNFNRRSKIFIIRCKVTGPNLAIKYYWVNMDAYLINHTIASSHGKTPN